MADPSRPEDRERPTPLLGVRQEHYVGCLLGGAVRTGVLAVTCRPDSWRSSSPTSPRVPKTTDAIDQGLDRLTDEDGHEETEAVIRKALVLARTGRNTAEEIEALGHG